ncbi:Probable rRNA-processing protein EBP2 homolog [Linum grandiflorum]
MGAPKPDSVTKDEELMEEEDDDVSYEDNSEFTDESESDSDQEGDVKLDVPAKEAIFNRDGLNDKLQEISWPEEVGWLHKLSLDINQEQEVDVNDDLTREMAFYTQALEGTRRAFEKFETLGLPFLRPADYYAEMVKSDSHMVKIKNRLLAEKRNMEEAEERRKAREAKKLSKEVQAQKQKERAVQKKGEIEAVKKWRKDRKDSGYAQTGKNDELDFDFAEGKKPFAKSSKQRPGVGPGDRSGGKGRKPWKSGGGKPDKKRERKETKFGYGGRKGMRKQNTAETTDDFKGFKKSGADGNKRRRQ